MIAAKMYPIFTRASRSCRSQAFGEHNRNRVCAALVTVFKRMRVDARGHCGVGVPCPGSYFRQRKSAQQNGNVLVSEVVEAKSGEAVVIARSDEALRSDTRSQQIIWPIRSPVL